MSFELTHKDIWQAIDQLAKANDLSPSGLAIKAGLDSTAFNRSKRSKGGKDRWPSTESIAKILAVTTLGHADFFAAIQPRISIRGEFRRRHNHVIHFRPQNSHDTFAYALFPSQVQAFDAARLIEDTPVNIISPYVDGTGTPRLRGLHVPNLSKLVF